MVVVELYKLATQAHYFEFIRAIHGLLHLTVLIYYPTSGLILKPTRYSEVDQEMRCIITVHLESWPADVGAT